jgi:uncharacterized membrane protein
MRSLSTVFLKGLAAILPVALTLYLLLWLGTTAESILGQWLRFAIPAHRYWPGLGLVVGVVVVFIVGLLVNAYVVRRVIRTGESLLERIPVVKTIYGAFKDVTRFLPEGGKDRDLKRVVIWRFGSAHVIGFVTEDNVDSRSLGMGEADVVAVYFPMSYQIGGYTLYLPRSELRETDLSVQEAMRLVLLGGISSRSPAPDKASGAGQDH